MVSEEVEIAELFYKRGLASLANAVITEALEAVLDIRGLRDISDKDFDNNLAGVRVRVVRDRDGEIPLESIKAFVFLADETQYGHQYWFGIAGKAPKLKLFRLAAKQDPEGWAILMSEIPRRFVELYSSISSPPTQRLEACPSLPLL